MIACGVLTPGPDAVTSSLTAAIVALLSTSFALGAWSRGGLYCNHQDLSPKVRAVLQAPLLTGWSDSVHVSAVDVSSLHFVSYNVCLAAVCWSAAGPQQYVRRLPGYCGRDISRLLARQIEFMWNGAILPLRHLPGHRLRGIYRLS